MRRCLTGPTQTVNTQGDVWNTNEEVFNTANTNSGYSNEEVFNTQGDVWNHCVTNEEVFNTANTNSGYSG